MFHKRTSSVKHLSVNSIVYSAAVEIGDSSSIHSLTRALALQREGEIFFGNEHDFSAYSVFHEPFFVEPENISLHFEKKAMNPYIKVQRLKVNALSTSAVLQIGSTKNVSLETRLKHIRHLKARPSS